MNVVALLTFSLLSCSPQSTQQPDRPRVLIIGDSISQGYTPHVIRLLKDVADVRHHRGNAQHTATGLRKIDGWIGDTEWDVIHFNWGLWDLCYRHPESKVQGRRDKKRGTLTTTKQQYEDNLEQLVRRLKQTNAHLIWGSTTVVPAEEAGRKQGDDLQYNEIAASVMARHGVTINDLNGTSRKIPSELFVKAGDVHFKPEGYQRLAKTVASAIREKLDSAQAEPVSRIHFGSCIKQDRDIPVLKAVLDDRPQAFVFLGDNIYGDSQDMQVLSAKYDALGRNPEFQKLRGQARILATWDDHDYGVNDGGAGFPVKRESQQLFESFWRSTSGQSQHEGVYDAMTIGPSGRCVQIILLDTRYFRSPLKKGDRRTGGPWVPDDDPEKTMLGEQQWKWLETQLHKPADVRIIASSIQFIASDDGQETWSNLPQERLRMLRLLKNTKANNVMFISGDRHWSEFSKLESELNYPLFDFTSSSLNQRHGRGTPTKNAYRMLPKTWHSENFGVLLLDWSRPHISVTCQIKDMNGSVVMEHMHQFK